MNSTWYGGNFAVAQGWGCTSYTAEPYDSTCPTKHVHRGIDIMLPWGTDLWAPVDGITLTQIGYDPNGFGPHYPILRLPDGTQYLFGHTSQVIGGPRRLSKGEVFAKSGSEGMSTGPHIHAQANATPGDFRHTKNPVPYLNLQGGPVTPTPPPTGPTHPTPSAHVEHPIVLAKDHYVFKVVGSAGNEAVIAAYDLDASNYLLELGIVDIQGR